MPTPTRLLIALLATLCIFTPASRAQEQPQSPAWRFVDAQTLAILRLNLANYDRTAFEQWLTATVKTNTDPVTFQHFLNDPSLRHIREVPEKLRAAGIGEIYFIATLSDIPHGTPGRLVIPLPANTDHAKVARTFFETIGEKPDAAPANAQPGEPVLRAGRTFALPVDGALVIANGDHTRFVNSAPAAAPRPDLAKALAAAGDASVALAFSPNDDTRKVIEQMLPQLPPPANVPSTVLTRGVRSAYLAASFPPKQSLQLHIQSDSPEAAKNLHDLLTRLLAIARNDPGFRHNVPAADQIVDALTPALDNDHVRLTLDPAATDRVTALLATGLANARAQALRVQSMSNLKQIGMGLMLYATEHKNAYPDSLDKVTQDFGDPAQAKRILTNPLDPARSPAYAYVKPPTLMPDTPADRLIAYETFDQWPGQVSVLFADGHVEAISDQNHFQKLLQEAKEPKAAKQP